MAEEKPITYDEKVGEAVVWGMGAVGMATWAVINYVEHGIKDPVTYGPISMAAVTAGIGFDSLRKARKLRQEETSLSTDL